MKRIWDIHCHILPTVDDGAKNLLESLALIREEAQQGVENIILTPHYRRGMFDTDLHWIEHQRLLLMEELDKIRAQESWTEYLNIYLGCEFHADEHMVEMLKAGFMPTMNGSKCVLVEFSSADEFSYIRETCDKLIRADYIPVIAHAERYPALTRGGTANLKELVSEGSLIQLNANSFLGELGISTRNWCHRAVKEDLVHFIASDTHNTTKRPPRMKECSDLIHRKYGRRKARELFNDNAEKYFGIHVEEEEEL